MTISVPQRLYEKLRRRAQSGGQNPDDLARDLLAEALQINPQPMKKNQRLGRLIDLRFHGPTDLAQNIDHYLYDA